MLTIETKEKLNSIIKELLKEKVILAFSGGVDSSLLLKLFAMNRENKDDVIAVTFNSTLQPKDDLDITKKLADEEGVELIIDTIDQITDPNVVNNRVDRCYHCKHNLFSGLVKIKEKLQYGYVVDGSNMDDFKVYRPGKKALKELKVVSPLLEAGFTKAMVREYAKELGVKVHSRPSAPCLATRFPYNEKIDFSKFPMIEAAENYLKDLGFAVNRVRVYGDLTRIEILKEQFMDFFGHSDEIVAKFKEIGFKYVNLDMQGFRSGSMDEVLDDEQKAKFTSI